MFGRSGSGPSLDFPVGGTTSSRQLITAYSSTADTLAGDDPLGMAKRQHDAADQLDDAALLQEHVEAWSVLWSGGVEVDDPVLARQINASLYAMFSATRGGEETGFDWPLSPGGLSTDGYWGTACWDQETWQSPGDFATFDTPFLPRVFELTSVFV